MSDAIAVALITSALALIGTVSVAWLQSFSAPRRLEQQVNALKTMAPLVEKELPATRDAYESVARQIIRRHRVRPWWKRVAYAVSTAVGTVATVAVSTNLARYLNQARLTPGMTESTSYALDLSLFIVLIAALIGLTLMSGFRCVFGRFERGPWSFWTDQVAARLSRSGEQHSQTEPREAEGDTSHTIAIDVEAPAEISRNGDKSSSSVSHASG